MRSGKKHSGMRKSEKKTLLRYFSFECCSLKLCTCGIGEGLGLEGSKQTYSAQPEVRWNMIMCVLVRLGVTYGSYKIIGCHMRSVVDAKRSHMWQCRCSQTSTVLA
jgi:hypothetical protein